MQEKIVESVYGAGVQHLTTCPIPQGARANLTRSRETFGMDKNKKIKFSETTKFPWFCLMLRSQI